MNVKQKAVKVNIFGREYTIRGEGDKDQIERLALLVNRKMTEISKLTSETGFGDIAVLACLNMADEFEKIKKENKNNLKIITGRIDEIVGKIEEKIATDGVRQD